MRPSTTHFARPVVHSADSRCVVVAALLGAATFFCAACLILAETASTSAEEPKPTPKPAEAAEEEAFERRSIRGRIVWLSEAMQRRFQVRVVDEASERVVALETADGRLIPILEDIRGRAFRKDERLRNLADCELLVRQYEGAPFVQIIRLFSHEDGTKYELDYFCEICAITMFELKPCDCCQGAIELRRREVDE